MFTGKQLAAFCEAVYKAAWVYWYGTYGKRCTEPLYESKKKQYPKHYTADRAAGYQKDIREKKWCADCVGMIKAFFWKGGDLTAEPKYATNHCPDVSANGMIALCAETGPIRTMPDIPGLVVWKNGHIGVYVAFVGKNMLMGLIASICALGVLALGVYYLLDQMDIILFPLNADNMLIVSSVVIGCGLLLTLLASLIATGRYIRMSTDTMYEI